IVGQPAVVAVVGAEHLPADPNFPALLTADGDRFHPDLLNTNDPDAVPLAAVRTTDDPAARLRDRTADAAVVIPADFAATLAANGTPAVTILFREGDDKAKLAARRLSGVLRTWEGRLREARFVKAGLPKDFDRVLTIEDPQADKPRAKKAADELRDTFAKVFPFLLMMWLIAGSIQPAVDMTAGEKERGTMETLLISPATRPEIVLGKFFATAAFAAGSVAWNVLWLAAAAVLMERVLGHPIVNLAGMFGCLVLALPQAMLFAAVCVALGVFAKSTKEGQYYLLPLVLVAMPLSFWSMTPGMRIGPGNFWVPVTGAMLLQQQFLSVSGEPVPWEYLLPVLGSLGVWIGLALAFAVWQFTREDVLFRGGGGRPGLAALLGGIFRRPAASVPPEDAP
ncbi:MAG: ABC transporter permease, partial [Fimbriiglobus sp.]